MERIVTPSKEVVDRVKRLGFEDTEACWYGFSRTMAVLKKKMFDPVYYLGTTTILKYKLKNHKAYALSRTGPVFSGNLIKMAIKILGKKRIRLYLHWRDKEFGILMIGTKEGTVAIAPRILDEGEHFVLGDYIELLSDYWRGPTGKLVRGLLFGTL